MKKKTEKEQWDSLRIDLNKNYSHSKHWDEAIEIFNLRLKGKYLDPVNRLIELSSLKGEGFVILTIQCALIENFAAFKEGLIFNHQLKKESPSYEYKESKKTFVNFLNTETIFEGIFFTVEEDGRKVLNSPFVAGKFYSDVRCGLMHEARTKGNWRITGNTEEFKKDGEFIYNDGEKLMIHRTLLQEILKKYFKSYRENLRAVSDEGNRLRRLFSRKMDHLYDVKDDFEWWEDK